MIWSLYRQRDDCLKISGGDLRGVSCTEDNWWICEKNLVLTSLGKDPYRPTQKRPEFTLGKTGFYCKKRENWDHRVTFHLEITGIFFSPESLEIGWAGRIVCWTSRSDNTALPRIKKTCIKRPTWAANADLSCWKCCFPGCQADPLTWIFPGHWLLTSRPIKYSDLALTFPGLYWSQALDIFRRRWAMASSLHISLRPMALYWYYKYKK